MREIKFRAWDKSFKIMSKPFQGELVNAQDQIHSLTELLRRHDVWEVMQFTGLKDKNGKEIYEGDILEFDPDEWGSDKGNRWAVGWDDESGEWQTGGGTNRECKSFKTVIGNIYQNPDLLK